MTELLGHLMFVVLDRRGLVVDEVLVGSKEFWKALAGYRWPRLALGSFVRFQILPDMSKKLEGASMVPMARPGGRRGGSA